MGSKSDDGGKDEPSLELPSLTLPGLRRRRKTKKEPAPEPVPQATEPQSPEVVQEPVPPAADPAPAPRVEQPAATTTPMDDEPGATRTTRTTRTTQHRPPPTQPVAEPVPNTAPDEGGRRFTLPAVPGIVAAIVTGVLVGVLGVLLTFAALAGCELARGTSTCGGPGFFLLVAIVIVMILAGTALLKAWQVSDPGSTSFLAVGVVAVIVLVVLIDVIFSGWMFLVVPIVSAAAYSLAHWVTTRFVEDEGPGAGPDVR